LILPVAYAYLGD